MLWDALLYAILGGMSFGTYPLFIRTPAVIQAKPHTIVFQLYKSSVVFLSGFLFLIPRYINWSNDTNNKDVPLFVFNWWAILSAAFWIPAGLFTIFSVPIIGMGLQVSLAASSSSILTFLAFWLIFGTEMKSYSCGTDCKYYLAPLYLFCTVLGMVTLIFSEKLTARIRKHVCDNNINRKNNTKRSTEYKRYLTPIIEDEETETGSSADESSPMVAIPPVAKRQLFENNPETSTNGFGRWTAGVLLSLLGGFFASGQFAVVQQGKKIEEINANCLPKNVTCPATLIESFDTFGSWYVSFGIGAMAVTVLLLVGLSCSLGRCPNFHWNVLKSAGTKAGIFWVFGNFFVTLAVVRGGNAVIMAQVLSTMIITSGCWGLIYYKEGDQSSLRKFLWIIAAVFTLLSMIMLGFQKIDK